MQTFTLDFPESKGFIREDYCSMEGSLGGYVFGTGTGRSAIHGTIAASTLAEILNDPGFSGGNALEQAEREQS
jgi:hypothetical protein